MKFSSSATFSKTWVSSLISSGKIGSATGAGENFGYEIIFFAPTLGLRTLKPPRSFEYQPGAFMSLLSSCETLLRSSENSFRHDRLPDSSTSSFISATSCGISYASKFSSVTRKQLSHVNPWSDRRLAAFLQSSPSASCSVHAYPPMTAAYRSMCFLQMFSAFKSPHFSEDSVPRTMLAFVTSVCSH